MPQLSITKTYVNGAVLSETDLDNIKTSIETFINTTKLDADNIQISGIADAVGAAMTATGANAVADTMTATGADLIAGAMSTTGTNALIATMAAAGANSIIDNVSSFASDTAILAATAMGSTGGNIIAQGVTDGAAANNIIDRSTLGENVNATLTSYAVTGSYAQVHTPITLPADGSYLFIIEGSYSVASGDLTSQLTARVRNSTDGTVYGRVKTLIRGGGFLFPSSGAYQSIADLDFVVYGQGHSGDSVAVEAIKAGSGNFGIDALTIRAIRLNGL